MKTVFYIKAVYNLIRINLYTVDFVLSPKIFQLTAVSHCNVNCANEFTCILFSIVLIHIQNKLKKFKIKFNLETKAIYRNKI